MDRHMPLARPWTLAAVLVLVATACSQEPGPTALDPDAAAPEEPVAPTQALTGNSVLVDRAHRFGSDEFDLASSPLDLAEGVYRFRPLTRESPRVDRDDFVIVEVEDGQPAVRRVLDAHTEGETLVMETGHAYWHEVIQSGTYTVTLPLDGRGEGRYVVDGPQQASYAFTAGQMNLPPLEATFEDVDVCGWVNSVLALIPGSTTREVCGKEVDVSVAYGASVSVAGTLDSLKIVSGWVRLTGDMDIATTVESGSISGGRAPVFSPCNRAAYAGCLSTPTGANLIEFLRRYAPSIPEASLPAVRVCIPGTPVRVRRGYWSGWTWNPPVWETCRITDSGQLPTVVLPSVAAASNEVRPRMQGEMTVRIKGDGVFAIEIPIPFLSLGSWGAEVTDDFKAAAKVGGFLLVRASLLNGGGSVKLTFDDTGRVTQTWTDAAGWGHDFALTDENHSTELLEIDNPDSVVVRVGVPFKVKAEVCIAITKCGKADDGSGDPGGDKKEFELDVLGKQLIGDNSGINIGANFGASVSMFYEAAYTRDQIHPDSADIDNWHISVDGAYDAHVEAGVSIPLTGWILPNVPREYDETWECCRVSVSDYWGQGRLQVTTNTTGTDIDSDGYSVLVQRADSLPALLDPGAQRLGRAWAPTMHEQAIGAIDGSTLFGPAVLTPCIGVYSDAVLVGNPVWGLSVAGARAAGVGIPTYGITSPCPWLIARYEVTLAGVSENCTVIGGAVKDSVWLQQRRTAIRSGGIVQPPSRGDTTYVHFDVECGPVGAQGSLEVVLPPGVRGRDEAPYVLLDGSPRGTFTESDTLLLTGLAPGSYEVTIQGLSQYCTSDAAPASVLAGQVTSLSPGAVCAVPDPDPGTVTITAAPTGEGTDGNGYRIARDGVTAAHLPVDGFGIVSGLEASTPTVIAVTDIAGNCQAQGLNPRVVTLDGARSPVAFPFPVLCLAEKPDTLVGTVDAQGWPAPTVTVRATDGTTLVVNGPKTGELVRLTGTSVRVWGQASATGINVHGYDLRSTLGDDRWLGIVLDRADGTWLFGDEAVRLINPPAGLVGASGSFVWIMGAEVDGGVQPTLYGVIRGGSE